MANFYGWDSTASRLQSQHEKTVYFLPLITHELLVLTWSTTESWKAESTCQPPSDIEPVTPGLGIQCPDNHEMYMYDTTANLSDHDKIITCISQ